MTGKLRFGTLGAARITPMALTKPARRVPEVEVTAMAARDRTRAEKFAAKHGIPTVHDSYEALVADPDIDAIYNPLPNSHHAVWTVRALEAGKHVLCEKPFTANAAEAEVVAKAAAASGRVVMEAFHYRHHPLAIRLREIVDSGELGAITRVETAMVVPYLKPNDIRYRLELAGGSTMDVGCYALNLLRHLGGPSEPTVVSARAKTSRPGVDRWLQADVTFPEGHTGRMTCGMASARFLSVSATVTGTDGRLRVLNPYGPQYGTWVSIRSKAGRRRETFTRDPTYLFQLRAFATAVLDGGPVVTDVADAVANMRAIDAAYTAAGLQPREGVPIA